MAENRLRLRLQGLLHCWYCVPPGLGCIADLCSNIVHTFQLQESCTSGVSLYMDGYFLPPTQPLDLLTDKDIISVQRKQLDTAEGNAFRTCISTDNGSCESVGACSYENSVRKQEQVIDGACEVISMKRKLWDCKREDALSDDLVHKKAKLATESAEGKRSEIARTLLSNKQLLRRTPKSPWVSFPVLLGILREKLPASDIAFLQQQYTGFKLRKVPRENLVKVFKDIAGEKTVRQAIMSMQHQAANTCALSSGVCKVQSGGCVQFVEKSIMLKKEGSLT